MDIQHPNSISDICYKHNQPILIYNSDPNIGACCLFCLQQQPGNISVEQFNKLQNEIYEKANKVIDFNHQKYQQLLDQLLISKQKLEKIIQIIIDYIKTIKNTKNQLNEIKLLNSNYQQRIIKLQQALDNLTEEDQQFKDQVKKQLNELSSIFSNIDEKMQILSRDDQLKNIMKVSNEGCMRISIQEVNVELEKQKNKFQYELIKESTRKEESACRAFAFNKENRILIVAVEEDIVIYEFSHGYIKKELQRLNNHNKYVRCLYIMKKSNSFISGSEDNIIIIWILDQKNQWVAQQVLREHNAGVICIFMNKIENLLISGSDDGTIKFWNNITGSWTCSKSIQTMYQVINMCINEAEDKLIVISQILNRFVSCIQVLMLNNQKEWEIIQSIDFQKLGYRLGFTVGDQFVFTTEYSDQIEIYDYDIDRKQFKKVKSLKIHADNYCYYYFPCQFIQSLKILTFKNGRYLNIIKVDENKNYQLIQEVKFGDYLLYGCISDDGQYIATYDEQSLEMQFRKVKYQI